MSVHEVRFQIQERSDENLIVRKADKIRRVLDSGRSVKMVVHMQGEQQLNNHANAYVLLERVAFRAGYEYPPPFEPNIPEGNVSTTFLPERRSL